LPWCFVRPQTAAFRSMQSYAIELLWEEKKRDGGFWYGSICLDEILAMRLPRRWVPQQHHVWLPRHATPACGAPQPPHVAVSPLSRTASTCCFFVAESYMFRSVSVSGVLRAGGARQCVAVAHCFTTVVSLPAHPAFFVVRFLWCRNNVLYFRQRY
jgi:hypothetical protein